MQPLIRDNNPRTTLNNNGIKYKNYNGKSLCIIFGVILISIIVAIAYFGSNRSSSSSLNNNNPARNFIDKPDNSFSYPSSIQWKDPKRRLPPKPKVPAEQADDESASLSTGGYGSTGYGPPSYNGGNAWDNPMNANPPQFGSDDWKTPPSDVGQLGWGGDDVALIDRGDDFQVPSDGEVPLGWTGQEEPEPEPEDKAGSSSSSSSSYSHPYRPDPVYPTSVNIDNDRIIIDSDASKASIYYKANGDDDIISEMPYLVKDTCDKSQTKCQFKQYSGYLLANNNAEIHYWFIEAEQEPENRPIFFWTNGGPGCSGMDGLLTEHGPWKVTDNLKIVYNKYSWNTEVNMVYLEQPFGVGFSKNEANEDVVTGDQNAADDMDAAIRNFLTKFPRYKDNKIFLSSESWGGHYVPITSYTILQNNDAGSQPNINFAGFFLGNPYTDFYENSMGFVGDIYGHGLMKSKDWDTWRDDCWGNEKAIDEDSTCSSIYTKAYISAYNANVYALDWPQCADDMDWNMDLLNRPAPSFWIKDAHIHHAARLFMEKLLANHDYKALKMSLEKSELQQLHDKIAQRLELEQDDYYGYGYDQSQYGYGQSGQQQQQQQDGFYASSGYDESYGYGQSGTGQSGQGLPGQQKPEDQPGYNGYPTGGGGNSQNQGGMPGQQGGTAPVQGMPQQPSQGSYPGQQQQQQQQQQQSGYQGTQQMPTRKVPRGGQHGRPNHNLGNKVPDFAKAGYAGNEENELTDDDDENVESGYDMTEDYEPCIEYDMQDYLNLATVQQALHVKSTEWQMCSDTVWNSWPQDDYDTKIEAFYAEIIDNYLINKNLKLAIYSGDDDSVCGLQGTQYWLDRWKYKVNEEKDYVEWKDDNNQLGGFYSQYMTDNGNNVALHFLTVRTAGHMVPTTQPARALTILKKYLYQFDNDDDEM